MKVQMLSRKDEEVKFLLEGASVPFANALRRLMVSHVPTFAIENVTFVDNGSVLYDEIIAHRLGLVPLVSDPKEMEKDSKSTVIFTLEKEGPGVVYTSDLRTTDKNVRPVHSNIPITELTAGQKLILEAEATIGTGAEHAKWQPTTACAYKHLPVLKVSGDCNGCEKCVEACPRKCLKMGGSKPKMEDEQACSLCKSCVEACPKSAITVTPNTETFLFTIESSGVMPASDIVLTAARVLGEKTEEFAEELKKL